jgi:hypothetical protein
MPACRGCGAQIEPSKNYKQRVWCSDACRKRAARSKPKPRVARSARPKIAQLGIVPGSSGLVDRVAALVEDQIADGDDVAQAQAALSLELAQLSAAGSVSACRELRLALLELRVASDPSWEGEASEALIYELLMTVLHVPPLTAVEPASLDWPPGWRSTMQDGELLDFVARRWLELFTSGDLEALTELELWVRVHLDELASVRQFGERRAKRSIR